MSETEHPNTYSVLKTEGPTASTELSNGIQYRDRERGVTKLQISTSISGELTLPTQASVYYIDGEHDSIDILRVWLDANTHIRDENSDHILHRAFCSIGSDWKDASNELLDPDYSYISGGDGTHETGGECPLCGDEYTRYLSDHLPCGGSDE